MAFLTDLKFIGFQWRDLGTDDRIYGGDTGDVVTLHGGNDLFLGGDGNDTVYDLGALYGGFGGDDVIALGRGNDTLISAFDLPNNLSGGSHAGYYGGLGTDTMDFSIDTQTGVVVDLAQGFVDSTIVSYKTQAIGFENVTGTNFGDFISGDGGDNQLSGLSGDDTIGGADGNDGLYGGDGADTLRGEAGNDYLSGDAGKDRLEGGDGNDTMYGGDGTDFVYGGNGNDYSLGGGGDDLMYGGAGDDSFFGLDGKDVIFADDGNDTAGGGLDDDIVYGGNGNDTVSGDEGNDYVLGGAGSDTVNGNLGADRLTGGLGKDLLTGGSEADTFVFTALNESSFVRANADHITDFQHGVDDIDVSLIDANVFKAGNQAFKYIGDHTFSKAGQISSHWDAVRNETVVSFNTDNDRAAEMKIVLDGHITLNGGDFIL
jgi:Ca2+-binding RTX toxin-like protein